MPWLGTFHAIGVKILRSHAELVGLKSGFTILDTDDQIRLIKQVIEGEGLDKDRWPARQLAALIDSWKNRGLTPDKVPRGEAFAFAEGKGAALYAAYQKRLKELNAADFGDLLLEVLRLFLDNPDVLALYQRRFRYTLVDEYQDTNVAQYLWLRLIAGGSPNICCVGDDDQSIYGWRGRRGRQHPALRGRTSPAPKSSGWSATTAPRATFSPPPRASSPITRAGSARPSSPTTIWVGLSPCSACGTTRRKRATIGEDIEALHKAGTRLNDMAILVRASFQMRAFETASSRWACPYRVIGGPRFYERQEIKDAIAYLEVTLNPPTTSSSSASSMCPSAGSATPPCGG
jgi:DNA helicase-2/ATP-dependent DNA helicase PcrA